MGGPNIARRARVSRSAHAQGGCEPHLDRIEEARAALRQLIESRPGLTIARFKAPLVAGLLAPKNGIFVDGLRKAGLPEE
jgi:hypothetical protein